MSRLRPVLAPASGESCDDCGGSVGTAVVELNAENAWIWWRLCRYCAHRLADALVAAADTPAPRSSEDDDGA